MRKIPFTHPLVGFVILVILIAPGVVFLHDSEPSRKTSLYTEKIERGLQFYDQPRIEPLRIDDYLLFVKIKYERGESVSPGSERPYAADPFRRILNKDEYFKDIRFIRQNFLVPDKLTLNRNFYAVNPPYAGFLRDPWDDILLRALYCDLGDYGKADFDLLRSLSDDGNYLDTHALLGLIMLRENRCFETALVEQSIDDFAERLVDTMGSDRVFSDVYAERIVFLYWAGFGTAVKREWIDRIAENLTPDPGWRSGDDTTSNAHTTGLALLALLYYQDGSAEQPFFVER